MRQVHKHRNWSASALFCLNSRAQSNCAVINFIHTWHRIPLQSLYDRKAILLSFFFFKYNQRNKITLKVNESILRARGWTLHYTLTPALGVRRVCTKILTRVTFCVGRSVFVRSVRGVYEFFTIINFDILPNTYQRVRSPIPKGRVVTFPFGRQWFKI